ncbi:hypothetical protein MGYG_08937 [Nannizzia gypsea CBS 118893]|uniref:Transcription factor domain-containing protein n=1 Tax=Arthroderma gypseum (strain ATCC MYA-4604 / CBS 118893) TaxID=535722 RepID=E5R1T5_ARTGP|nr:hypothetical protein MGYG_08937 [Nannizzia gypsea CBS 118893]EFQ98569.1 hypothetical protein MGYG_08937 [Nannizzia gypsea CBS 118893]
MPFGGGSITTSSDSQDSSSVAAFPWSPEVGNADLTLQNINNGGLPTFGLSSSLGWNDNFLTGDYPSEFPSELLSFFAQTQEQHNMSKPPAPHMSGPGEPLSLSQMPPLPPLSGAPSSIELSPNGDFSCDDDFFANNFLPGPSTVADNITELFEELSQRVRDYPKKILQRDFWSPFIHHSLYRCAQGGMAEPLGIALACASAYNSCVESSSSFIDTMINTQREKLIREFHLYVDQPETCLAALHAVSVYQILSSLDDRSTTTTIGPAETDRPRTESGLAAEFHISFLLKMTRRLCSLYKQAVTSDTETDWSRWRFAESLRRCIFFVNLINVLAARCRRFHFDYFEPLDDALILQMPLPATEQAWKASNEIQWQICRDDTQLVRPAPTLQKLMEIDDAGRLDRATLTPLTRIILACARVNLEADWRDV